LRRRARRPGLQTRFARTAGPGIPVDRAAAAAAAKSATASPLAHSSVFLNHFGKGSLWDTAMNPERQLKQCYFWSNLNRIQMEYHCQS
jgi:hypothetical protein